MPQTGKKHAAKLRAIIIRLERQQSVIDQIREELEEIAVSQRLLGTRPQSLADLERFERDIVAFAIEKCGGHQSEAARMLGIGRDRLRYKMTKHGLT